MVTTPKPVDQRKSTPGGLRLRFILVPLAMAMAGCDPVIDVAGANFPPGCCVCWLERRWRRSADRCCGYLGLDPYIGPAPLIYSCLAAMFALIVWIIFFNRI